MRVLNYTLLIPIDGEPEIIEGIKVKKMYSHLNQQGTGDYYVDGKAYLLNGLEQKIFCRRDNMPEIINGRVFQAYLEDMPIENKVSNTENVYRCLAKREPGDEHILVYVDGEFDDFHLVYRQRATRDGKYKSFARLRSGYKVVYKIQGKNYLLQDGKFSEE